MKKMNAWKWVWFLGALLVATPSFGADIYVDNALGDDALGDGTSGAPYATLAKAADVCANGDRIRIVASATPYGPPPEPTPSTVGTGNVITFLGDSSACNKVILTGGTIIHQNMVFNGVRFNSSLTIGVNGANSVIRSHIRNCVINGSLTILGSNTRIDNVKVGTDSVAAGLFVDNWAGCSNVVIKNCTMYLRYSGPTVDWFLMRLQPEGGYAIQGMTFTNNKITMTVPVGSVAGKITMFNRFNSCALSDNKYTFRDSSGFSSGGPQGFLIRDGWFNNTMVRDTIIASSVNTGTSGALRIDLMSSGNSYAGSGNSFRFLNVKQSTNGTLGMDWGPNPGDSVSYCVFADSSSAAVGNSFRILALRGGVFYRNTFFNKTPGAKGALYLAPASPCAGGATKFINNIFYTGLTSATNGAAYYGIALSSSTVFDYNCFSAYSDGHELFYGGCSPSGPWAIGSSSSICGSKGWDCHSVYGTPAFTDSTFANLNANIATTGVADSAGVGGSDIGAFDAPYPDATRPDEITDLTPTCADYAVSLAWTSTGDDSLTGTADHYDLRMSTATITSGNFTSATQVASPTPAVAGTLQFQTINNLTKGVTYYFAIILYDENNNPSAISNVASCTTGQGVEP